MSNKERAIIAKRVYKQLKTANGREIYISNINDVINFKSFSFNHKVIFYESLKKVRNNKAYYFLTVNGIFNKALKESDNKILNLLPF